MYTPTAIRSANAYKRVAIDTSLEVSSPHQLVTMLFDELLRSLECGRRSIADKNTGEKIRHIGRAMRILEEGLRAPLNLGAGGELASNLHALYEYCSHRLVIANARNDGAILQEIIGLIQPVALSWKQIGGDANVSVTN